MQNSLQFIVVTSLIALVIGFLLGSLISLIYITITPLRGRFSIINGILYIIITGLRGFTLEGVIYCLFTSALLTLSVIDIKTYEIPISINIFILFLGIIRCFSDFKNILFYLAGFLGVSVIMFLIYFLSKKKIGGGDLKLMAVSGLLLGFDKIIFAMFLGCISAIMVNLIIIKNKSTYKIFAFGPYLALGLLMMIVLR